MLINKLKKPGSFRSNPPFKSFSGRTTIQMSWNVSPTKLWMRMSSLVARSVFMENHNILMEQAITGFTQMISTDSIGSGQGIYP